MWSSVVSSTDRRAAVEEAEAAVGRAWLLELARPRSSARARHRHRPPCSVVGLAADRAASTVAPTPAATQAADRLRVEQCLEIAAHAEALRAASRMVDRPGCRRRCCRPRPSARSAPAARPSRRATPLRATACRRRTPRAGPRRAERASAPRLARQRRVAVLPPPERHPHLGNVGVGIALGDARPRACPGAPSPPRPRASAPHRLLAGELLDDVDDQRRHLERLHRVHLAADGANDDLAALARARPRIEVRVGAVEVRPRSSARPSARSGCACMSSAMPIGTSGPTSARTRAAISPSASGAPRRPPRREDEQHAVPRAVLAQQLQHFPGDPLEGIGRDRADGSVLANSSGTTSTPGSSRARGSRQASKRASACSRTISVAAQDPNARILRRRDGEGVRLVVVPQQGQPHPPHPSLSNHTAPMNRSFARRIGTRRRGRRGLGRRQAGSGPQPSFLLVGPRASRRISTC